MRGEVTLPLVSFVIILLSAIFFFYAAQKERHLNQLKSELMANVSHELKTPLSVVRMFADMLRSGRVPSEQRRLEYLDIICRESERLTSLIDNVLDFSALETGKGPYRLKRGDLGEAIGRALDAFRYRSEQDGVEIRLGRSEGLPPVLIDQEAIALAVINLLDNAVKYGGSAEVSVQAERDSVTVRIEDRGPGIASEDQEKVFEAFYRLDRSRSRETGGTGLGLTVAQNIIRAHGGTIALSNRADGGLRVEATLPR